MNAERIGLSVIAAGSFSTILGSIHFSQQAVELTAPLKYASLLIWIGLSLLGLGLGWLLPLNTSHETKKGEHGGGQ